MEYTVIRSFTDRESGLHYAAGDRYPRRGFANKKRAEELLGTNNAREIALIKAKEVVKVKEEPKTEEVEAEAVVEEKPKATRRKK